MTSNTNTKSDPSRADKVGRPHPIEQGTFNPRNLFGFLSILLGLWVLVGALAFQKLSEATIFFGMSFLGGFYFLAALLTMVECSMGSSPFDAHALFSASILGVCATLVYCAYTEGWNNPCHKLFWVIGGHLGSCLCEIRTGVLGKCMRGLEEWTTKNSANRQNEGEKQ